MCPRRGVIEKKKSRTRRKIRARGSIFLTLSHLKIKGATIMPVGREEREVRSSVRGKQSNSNNINEIPKHRKAS